MYFLLPSCSVILKHVFLNSHYFRYSKLLLNTLPSSGDEPCWGLDPGEHLVQQVSMFFVSILSQNTEQLSHACAVCVHLLRTGGEKCHPTDNVLHNSAPLSILTSLRAGANFAISEQQHRSVCKWFVVFSIWNLKYRSFHRLHLQTYIRSCLRESKNPISYQIKCQGSVSKET